MSFILIQSEADALLFMEKHYLGEENYSFPGLGGTLSILLHSQVPREEFNMDIYRGRIELRKNTFQTRTKKTVVLARLDIGGSIHRNPDGEETP